MTQLGMYFQVFQAQNIQSCIKLVLMNNSLISFPKSFFKHAFICNHKYRSAKASELVRHSKNDVYHFNKEYLSL